MPAPNPDLPPFDPARLAPVKRALISVSDKSRLIDQAQALHARGVKLVSTGGTHKAISEAGIPVKDVSELTKFPEMMDGRVKTLHPMVHGGLLGDRDLISHKDAKNHAHVAVCVDADDVDAVLKDMDAHSGQTTGHLRQKLAAKCYARSAAYDAAIANWFADTIEDIAPPYRTQAGTLRQTLRYGENPHQSAAFYTDGSNRGKALSYNNINDTDAAYELVAEFGRQKDGARPAVAIIKHANPCGVAVADDFVTAYKNALACDPVSAFGGIIALNGPLDKQTAQEIVKVFTEVVIAPSADEAALVVFSKKKNLRLLIVGG